MAELIEIASDVGPVAELIAASVPDGERAVKREQLRRYVTRAREISQEYAEQLARLYDDIERSGHDAEWLVQAAAVVQKGQDADRERLLPGIEAAKRKLSVRGASIESELRELMKDSITIAETWLLLRANLHRKLLKLSAKRRAAAGKIRHARPVKGGIDHANLSREHMARYPKIRARLAE